MSGILEGLVRDLVGSVALAVSAAVLPALVLLGNAVYVAVEIFRLLLED